MGRVLEKTLDSGMVTIVTWVILEGTAFPGIVLALYAQFDVGGDEVGVFLLVGEVVVVVVVVMAVVKIVGVVASQREHSEECNIEEGTLAEVVGEVVVRRVAEKEPAVVSALELVGEGSAFGDVHLKGLPKGLRCRKVLHALFGSPLPAVSSSFQVCCCFHVFMVSFGFFLFLFGHCW